MSIWLDTLSRELLESGDFAALVDESAVTGATSNPTIFAKAITGSDRYDEQLRAARGGRRGDGRELFFALALDDVAPRAADLLRPAYERSGGRDGFISFECTPDVADDAEATIAQALDLWHRLDLPNVLIKVPATAAGVGAIEELTARGVNVNVTLLFSVERYEEVIEAYLRGLERRRRRGPAGAGDRVGRLVLRLAHRRQGRRRARPPIRRSAAGWRSPTRTAPTRATCDRFAGARWQALESAGASPQRPLWASTGTKDPSYSDVLYVERLIAPGVINTMPERDPARLRRPRQRRADRSAPTTARRWASSPRPPPKASTSTRSPPSWNATASRPSATPTPSCCAASRASAAH